MKVFKIIGGTIKWFLICFALLVVIGVIVAIASLGKAASHDQQTSNRIAQVWSQVYVGESAADVKASLGPPDDVTKSDMSNFNGGSDHSETWMYGGLSNTSYFIDIENGTVFDKSTI